MNSQQFARRVLMFSHPAAARKALMEWYQGVIARREADITARFDVYDAHVQAVLPTLKPMEAQQVAAAWEHLKAHRATETDEEREALRLIFQRDLESSMDVWWPIITQPFDAIEDARPQEYTNEELARMDAIAGDISEWWDEYYVER